MTPTQAPPRPARVLPTVRSVPKVKSPKLLVLFGQQKVGKTTKLAELDDNLIIDTEHGTDYLSSLNESVNGLKDYAEVIAALKLKNPYRYLTLDTIDNIALWHERRICSENKVKNLIDMAYGAGYNLQREAVMANISQLTNLCERTVIVGHRKKSIMGEDSADIGEVTLDISGKLKNLIMAKADAVGYVFRGEDETLMISFKSSGGVDAGSRCEHLRNQVIPFEWDKIFID